MRRGAQRARRKDPSSAISWPNPKYRNVAYFVIDFDSQKDLVKRFGVRMQSTLIAFKGSQEEARSVGDTHRKSIAAL